MTIKRIKKWYLWIGLANFLLSVMFFIQNSESSSMEVFSAFIVSNVGYHLLYFFVGFFSRSSIKRIVQENRIAEITVWMNKLFAYVTIVIGILMSLLFFHPHLTSKLTYWQHLRHWG